MWAGVGGTGHGFPRPPPRQRALRKRRGGAAAWEWHTSSPVMGMAATTLARVKPGNAAATRGGQGKGSMAGAFPCLEARLHSGLSPATSFVLRPGNGAGVAHWMRAGHLCPWSCQRRSGW